MKSLWNKIVQTQAIMTLFRTISVYYVNSKPEGSADVLVALLDSGRNASFISREEQGCRLSNREALKGPHLYQTVISDNTYEAQPPDTFHIPSVVNIPLLKQSNDF